MIIVATMGKMQSTLHVIVVGGEEVTQVNTHTVVTLQVSVACSYPSINVWFALPHPTLSMPSDLTCAGANLAASWTIE
jgi:hypothetical protein